MNANSASSIWLINIAVFLACHAIIIVPLLLARLWLWGPCSQLRLQREAVIKTTIAVCFAMFSATAISLFLPQKRPFVVGIGYFFLTHAPDNSFPSHHSTVMFTCTLAFLFWYRIWCGGLLMILALGISWSRVYLGVHWPLDIVGAFLLSVISCLFARWIWNIYGSIIVLRLTRYYRFLFFFAIRKNWVKA